MDSCGHPYELSPETFHFIYFTCGHDQALKQLTTHTMLSFMNSLRIQGLFASTVV